jgi:hypothetical protein
MCVLPKNTLNRVAGLFVIVGGVCLIVVGLLIYSGGLNWFGKLPGDIRYESERVHFYAPIVSMLLVSLALSLIFYLLRRFF